jgi:hypothetical protein
MSVCPTHLTQLWYLIKQYLELKHTDPHDNMNETEVYLRGLAIRKSLRPSLLGSSVNWWSQPLYDYVNIIYTR